VNITLNHELSVNEHGQFVIKIFAMGPDVEATGMERNFSPIVLSREMSAQLAYVVLDTQKGKP
jgi:hypothetical protein